MSESLVIAIGPSRRPDARPAVIRCETEQVARMTAATLAIASNGTHAISVLGPDGEYRWAVSPFVMPEVSAKRSAA